MDNQRLNKQQSETLKKYIPKIKEMSASVEEDKLKLSIATNTITRFNKRTGDYIYIDKTTNEQISPEEYKRRYYLYIGKHGGVKSRKRTKKRKNNIKRTSRKHYK